MRTFTQRQQLKQLVHNLDEYADMQSDIGNDTQAASILAGLLKSSKQALKEIKALPANRDDPLHSHAFAPASKKRLEEILSLRPAAARKATYFTEIGDDDYRDRLAGAINARFAGCTLGAPVEFWSIAAMQQLADRFDQPFPPTDYWRELHNPEGRRYITGICSQYTRDGMDGVPVDDDTTYTLLGLLIAKEYGLDFTVADVAAAWEKYLPMACTAEKIALDNVRKGVSPQMAGAKNNPYTQWIGADIRSDPWGYLAAGCPEQAARMAYQDAALSHRGEGVFGEMYFSAAIAAAFVCDHPVEALEAGLLQIPQKCETAKAIRWALKEAPKIKNYQHARDAVDQKFPHMHPVHTINNACLTVFGLTLGERDLTTVLAETVAMGLDNDCTAATAGSICGAVIGDKNVPAHWTKNFNDTAYSYMKLRKKFKISSVIRDFAKLRLRG
jgi:ADP-ribosylglycohydrolase